MQTATIYYDTKIRDDEGRWSVGETCFDISLSDYNAEVLFSPVLNKENATYKHVEIILSHIEHLKGRIYVEGSIKCIERGN